MEMEEWWIFCVPSLLTIMLFTDIESLTSVVDVSIYRPKLGTVNKNGNN